MISNESNNQVDKPFRITVKTFSKEYIEGGAKPEKKQDAQGYVLVTFDGEKSIVAAQGKIDAVGIAKAILSLQNADTILMLANVLDKMNSDSSLASLQNNKHAN